MPMNSTSRLVRGAFVCAMFSFFFARGAIADSPIPFVPKAQREALLVPKTEREAMFVAVCAFRIDTKSEIDDYLVQRVEKPNKKEWVFFIVGQGPFARPGFYWDVRIDRVSGKTTIQRGI